MMLRHLRQTAVFARILAPRSPLVSLLSQRRANWKSFHSSAAGLKVGDGEHGEVQEDVEESAGLEGEEVLGEEDVGGDDEVAWEAPRRLPRREEDEEDAYEGEGGDGEAGDFGGGDREKSKEEIEADIYLSRKIIYLDGVKPDHSAAHLSDASKERMYKLHKEDPKVNTVDKLAADYRIRKQRVHAILWLKETEKKQEEELGHPLEDDIEKEFEEMFTPWVSNTGKPLEAAIHGEKHVAVPSTYPKYEIKPEGWEGNIKSEAQIQEELSAKEEEMLVEEFEQQMNFNKKKIAGLVKTHIMSRRRPADGWSYMVEELGLEGKRGKGGGHRFVVEPDGTKRKLNDLEKDFLRREKVRPRRRPSAR
ncbi:hypothetical protein O6H91_Y164400 [Diphasiastrum complanatum]|nr:hypothetical protein O6H91_Y164400 [Diphasiastrum complanatum]